MANKKTFYVTTPIYYVNAEPHVGSAYTTLAADIIARWHRLRGEQVFFLTGTDEHGQKIQEIAEKSGLSPKQFVDKISMQFKEVFSQLEITQNHFIRTTDKKHEQEVQRIVQQLYDKKYIYKGHYEAEYCVGCEQYKTKSELVDDLCPLHKTKPQIIKEEAYMFKLSAFQDKLLKLIEREKYKIFPLKRRNEVISFIKEGLHDISISRKKSKVSWGIELPFDKEHTLFVWVDAFWNYLTGLQAKEAEKTFWPPQVQLMANDILRVHATIWPALLLATNHAIPESLFVHGYFTVDGQKMSKSLGNVISPKYLVQKYGAETVRYFLFRNIVFGEDGDFSETSLVERHNNELANKLGNLVSRLSTLAEQQGLEKIKAPAGLKTEKLINSVSAHFKRYELDRSLAEIFAFIDIINTFLQNNKPWETKDKKVIYQAANALKDIAILISPFMPETAEKIAETFHFEISLKALKSPLPITKIKKSLILFKKIEMAQQNTKNQEAHKPKDAVTTKPNPTVKSPAPEGIAKIVDFQNWEKIDLRVGKIEKAEDIEGADKLYKLSISLGSEKRTICAGLKKFYKKPELEGKKCIIFTNLAPRMMKGITSQGMLLAAVSEDETQVVLLSPEKDIKEGSKVR